MTMRTARPRAALRQGRNDWFRLTRNSAAGTASLHIYDEIGYFGISASDLVAELSSLDASAIDLHLSSPGGEVFDGIAIYNALRSHRARITTYVDALAASIASVIAMAGDEVVMAPHSQMMIHDGLAMCVGNAAEMRELADLLDRQSDNIAGVYAERAGGTIGQWRKRMQAETWYTAQEAVDAGLADRKSTPQRQTGDAEQAAGVAANWDLSVFRYAGRDEAPAPDAVTNVATVEADPTAEVVTEEATPDEQETAPAGDTDEVEAEMTGWESGLFTGALNRVTNPFAYDPDVFRSVLAHHANNAPAVPAPAPVPDPDHDPILDATIFTRAVREATR